LHVPLPRAAPGRSQDQEFQRSGGVQQPGAVRGRTGKMVLTGTGPPTTRFAALASAPNRGARGPSRCANSSGTAPPTTCAAFSPLQRCRQRAFSSAARATALVVVWPMPSSDEVKPGRSRPGSSPWKENAFIHQPGAHSGGDHPRGKNQKVHLIVGNTAHVWSGGTLRAFGKNEPPSSQRSQRK